MKTKYKIIIACVITCILTAFATVYVMKQDIFAPEYMCKDNAEPDEHGCCPGETYTDMGDQGFNCCPDDYADCFPPITK